MDKVVINEVSYPINFGYGAFRLMGRKWGCKGIAETMERLSELENLDENMTFEQEDIIADLVISGIECANPELEIPSRDDVMTQILKTPEILTDVIERMMESFPQPGKDTKPGKKKKSK